MSKARDTATAYAEAGLSSLGQHAPRVAAIFTGLHEPRDVLLRWHVARKPRPQDLLHIAGHPGAHGGNIYTRGRYVLAADADLMLREAREYNRRPAMAHMLGSVGMVGEQVGDGLESFLQPLPPELEERLPPERQGIPHLAVVARVGAGEFIGGIGTVGLHGTRYFQAVDTFNLGAVAATPAGLHRV